MKITQYSQLKHGMKVKCKIFGVQVDDAKISIDQDGKAYICQNLRNGMDAENKLGYKHSWHIGGRNDKELPLDDNDVSDLETAGPRTIREMMIGDIIVSDDHDAEAMVLDVRERIFFRSMFGDFTRADSYYTFEEAERRGWKLKEEEPEVIELTMDQIAEKFGVSVEKLKIKKD